jgi:hypothetical protein
VESNTPAEIYGVSIGKKKIRSIKFFIAGGFAQGCSIECPVSGVDAEVLAY